MTTCIHYFRRYQHGIPRDLFLEKMSIVEKIKEIEAEMARTQKNKATAFHLGTLKAKLAKLKRELLMPKSGGGGGEGGRNEFLPS